MYPILRLYDGYPNTSPGLQPNVRKLQHYLGVMEDGYFGPDTQTLVTRYQTANGLSPDGVVGNKTWSKLLGKIIIDPIHLDERFMQHMLELFDQYRNVVTSTDVATVFGVGIRESHWGEILKPIGPSGTGDFIPRKGRLPEDGLGFGRGLMQIDYDAHSFARGDRWKNPAENIEYACNILLQDYKYFKDHYVSTITDRAALASYNCGRGNVQRAIAHNLDIDFYTTGRDYSKKVLEYVRWYQSLPA